jgi:hypothetical protein
VSASKVSDLDLIQVVIWNHFTSIVVEIEVSKLPDFEGLAIFAKVVQTRSFVGAAVNRRVSDVLQRGQMARRLVVAQMAAH